MDTCSLLKKEPLALARKAAAESGAALIVPQKVREELYGLLKDKRKRYAVIHAQQLISSEKWEVLPHSTRSASPRTASCSAASPSWTCPAPLKPQ